VWSLQHGGMRPFLLPLSLLLFAYPSSASSVVAITTTTLANGTVDTPFSATVSASGGCTPYEWAVVSGDLPSGIVEIPSSNTEALDLTGTPTIAGTYSFTVSVTGCGGHVSEKSYTVVIRPSVVAITTTTLPNGTVDTPFSATVNASGGYTPYTWALASGNLPNGISTEASSNTESLDLTGTPTATGTYTFTISVTGDYGHVSEKSYTVVIQAKPAYVVKLTWNDSTSSNISGYNIYRSPNQSTWEKLNTSLISSTTYSDDTVASGNTYYYAATAVNTAGVESAKSTIAEAVIP
jgi:Putative Ig domain